MVDTIERIGKRKAGNQGLVPTSGGNDLVHDMPIGRTARIVKIMAYNNTGADATLIFGTLDNAGAWVPLLPTLFSLDTFDNEWTSADLPNVEWAVDTTVAGGSIGDIYVQASVAGVLVHVEVEEFGS